MAKKFCDRESRTCRDTLLYNCMRGLPRAAAALVAAALARGRAAWPRLNRRGMADDAALWGDPSTLVTHEEIVAAQSALASYGDVLRTPLLRSWPVGGASMKISLKLESLQTTGSFKIRGMRYKIHASDVGRLRDKGVVTLSAGNAGRAVAYLAQQSGLDAKVFMPATAPDDRKRMMESLGARVVKVPGEGLLDAVAACIAEEGRVLVHPFDDLDVIRGHASCGLEILEDAPDADVIVVCCGGGRGRETGYFDAPSTRVFRDRRLRRKHPYHTSRP